MSDRKPLAIGGVMRCCGATLDDHEAAGGTAEEGAVLPCKYCKSALHVKDGMWRWFREFESPSPT